MTIDSVIHTNQHSIGRVLQTKLPVVLAFWSSAAPLTGAVEALLNDAAQQQAGKLLVAKVDAEAEAALRQQYRVQQ
jgi:thioredoxin-like negative regulator of GroEL